MTATRGHIVSMIVRRLVPGVNAHFDDAVKMPTTGSELSRGLSQNVDCRRGLNKEL